MRPRLPPAAVILASCAVLVPLAMALLATPAGAQAPTLVVSSPEPGAVVAGTVDFQGTAEDPDGNLDSVEIAIQGGNPTLKVKLPGGTSNATWAKSWNSQGAGDGLREVSIVAVDKSGETSAPTNFTLIIDNFKEPFVEASKVLFDSDGNAVYKRWNDLAAVPTTRVAFELRFSEPMDQATLQAAVNFAGGDATWALEPGPEESLYWIRVSYLRVDTAYNLTVANATSDMAGNPLTTYELSFRTASEATPGTPPPGGTFFLPVDPFWIWISGGVGGGALAVAVLYRKGLLRKIPEFLRGLPDRFRRRGD